MSIENISDTRNGFQIAGPKAREVLAACTRDDVSDMKFMDVRRMTVGMADCIVQRVSYTGDLGYRDLLRSDGSQRATVVDALWQAGQPHGMVPFGMRAMMSLRLDKFFGSWMRRILARLYCCGNGAGPVYLIQEEPCDFIGRERCRGGPGHAGPARTLVRVRGRCR